MPTCAATKRDGQPCTYKVHGTGVYCGRHKHLAAAAAPVPAAPVPAVPVPAAPAAPVPAAPAPKTCVAIKADGHKCAHPASHGSYCGHHIPRIDKQRKRDARNAAEKKANIQQYVANYAQLIDIYYTEINGALDTATTAIQLMTIIETEHAYYAHLTTLESYCTSTLHVSIDTHRRRRVRHGNRFLDRVRECALRLVAHPHALAPTYIPDPKDGINLAAFATDKQSVHRSSVQTSAIAMIDHLFQTIDVVTSGAQDAVCGAIQRVLATNPVIQERTIKTFVYDYAHIEACGHMYSVIVDLVWTYISKHAHKDELERRLVEELVDGYQQCSNGKMVRLVNTLQGFDALLPASQPSKELFQHRFAKLAAADDTPDHRERNAFELFREFDIPASEQGAWIEALRAW